MTGIFDDDLILPGVITDILSDYSSGYDTSKFGTTASTVVIGTAFNGPVGKVVPIYSPEHAAYVFGTTYDSTSKKEATLVADIQNVWDMGCRTIYAVRLSGKDMYKDFQLTSNTKCKLRVSGIFPNNDNKNVFFQYDAADSLSEIANGTEASIKFYKPASRATVNEKMQGKVMSDNAVLVDSVNIESNWSVNKATRLVDFIDLFNNYTYNNVLYLSIVDEDGNEITRSSEAQGLVFGDMFPGFYFIGRDRNASGVVTKTDLVEQFVLDDDASRSAIYDGFTSNIYKKLNVNTDVTKDLPIYHTNLTQLNQLIGGIDGISMSQLFDFLSVTGKVDLVWLKDNTDYEEVIMDNFDIYTKLGSGFATTAKIEKKGTGVYKVKEVTGENDSNKIVAISDGIYSMLENLKADYRVLTGVYADSEIKGSLPKKENFLIPNPISSSIFANTIQVTPKIDSSDLSKIAKNYVFELRSLPASSDLLSKDNTLSGLYKNNGAYKVSQYMKSVSDAATLKLEQISDGDLILVGDIVNKKVNGALTVLNASTHSSLFENKLTVAGNKVYELDKTSTTSLKLKEIASSNDIATFKYLCVSVDGKIYVYSINVSTDVTPVITVEPLALLDDVIEESNTIFSTIVPSIVSNEVVNKITIRALDLNITTLSEFIIGLNNDDLLSQYFSFDLGIKLSEEDNYISVLPLDGGASIFSGTTGDVVTTDSNALNTEVGNGKIVDRSEPIPDETMYIPFKTTDNFARQLAQHGIYTGLKTSSTHCVIGCSPLLSSNLKTIQDRVTKILTLDLDLYAKKSNGNNMLDKSNLPYPIGRVLSVTFFQNNVTTSSNYTYISSGASAYAGMVSVLDISQSSTNQPISLDSVGFELTNYQLGKLTQAGFITVKNSYSNGYVVTDGITMAPSTSVFRRLSVTRILNTINAAIRAVAEPYLGKQNHFANKNSLDTAIRSQLNKVLDTLIDSYTMTVITDSSNDRLGIIEIEYSIVPIYEIREVRNRLTVKES